MISSQKLELFTIVNFSNKGKQDRRLLVNLGLKKENKLFMPNSTTLENVDRLMWAEFADKDLIKDGGFIKPNQQNITIYDQTLMPEKYMLMFWFNKDLILFCNYSVNGVKDNKAASFEWNMLNDGSMSNRYLPGAHENYYKMNSFKQILNILIKSHNVPVAMFLQYPNDKSASMEAGGFDIKMSFVKDFESYMKFLAMIYVTRKTLMTDQDGKYLIRPNITAINEIKPHIKIYPPKTKIPEPKNILKYQYPDNIPHPDHKEDLETVPIPYPKEVKPPIPIKFRSRGMKVKLDYETVIVKLQKFTPGLETVHIPLKDLIDPMKVDSGGKIPGLEKPDDIKPPNDKGDFFSVDIPLKYLIDPEKITANVINDLKLLQSDIPILVHDLGELSSIEIPLKYLIDAIEMRHPGILIPPDYIRDVDITQPDFKSEYLSEELNFDDLLPSEPDPIDKWYKSVLDSGVTFADLRKISWEDLLLEKAIPNDGRKSRHVVIAEKNKQFFERLQYIIRKGRFIFEQYGLRMDKESKKTTLLKIGAYMYFYLKLHYQYRIDKSNQKSLNQKNNPLFFFDKKSYKNTTINKALKSIENAPGFMNTYDKLFSGIKINNPYKSHLIKANINN